MSDQKRRKSESTEGSQKRKLQKALAAADRLIEASKRRLRDAKKVVKQVRSDFRDAKRAAQRLRRQVLARLKASEASARKPAGPVGKAAADFRLTAKGCIDCGSEE